MKKGLQDALSTVHTLKSDKRMGKLTDEPSNWNSQHLPFVGDSSRCQPNSNQSLQVGRLIDCTRAIQLRPVNTALGRLQVRASCCRSRMTAVRRSNFRSKLQQSVPLDIGLLGHFKRVFDLNSQIPHGALDFGVPK